MAAASSSGETVPSLFISAVSILNEPFRETGITWCFSNDWSFLFLKTYKNNLASKSDLVVNKCISGEDSFEDSSKTTSVALYARYLKRVGAHLKNITTTIVNPFEEIGYKPPS